MNCVCVYELCLWNQRRINSNIKEQKNGYNPLLLKGIIAPLAMFTMQRESSIKYNLSAPISLVTNSEVTSLPKV